MEWLELQDKIGRLCKRYFDGRKISFSRIESAKNRDTGEQAKQIDAAIRSISRSPRKDDVEEMQLTEDEKDILAIRLDWALNLAITEAQVGPHVYGQTMTEDEFEELLINQWQKNGRDTYKTQQQKINEAFEKAGIKLTPPGDKKPEQGGDETKPPSPPGGFGGRRF